MWIQVISNTNYCNSFICYYLLSITCIHIVCITSYFLLITYYFLLITSYLLLLTYYLLILLYVGTNTVQYL